MAAQVFERLRFTVHVIAAISAAVIIFKAKTECDTVATWDQINNILRSPEPCMEVAGLLVVLLQLSAYLWVIKCAGSWMTA